MRNEIEIGRRNRVTSSPIRTGRDTRPRSSVRFLRGANASGRRVECLSAVFQRSPGGGRYDSTRTAFPRGHQRKSELQQLRRYQRCEAWIPQKNRPQAQRQRPWSIASTDDDRSLRQEFNTKSVPPSQNSKNSHHLQEKRPWAFHPRPSCTRPQPLPYHVLDRAGLGQEATTTERPALGGNARGQGGRPRATSTSLT